MEKDNMLSKPSRLANLTTQPYKGTSDWLPDEFSVQKYIFDTWREVCTRFGYKEYLTPLIEYADIYRAKSGEVKEELFTLQDRAGRDLALRPEMTPSVTRMVASVYKELPKPIRLFSIAPFYRNEAPQKGRNREFWQLNADIFGDTSINSDLEILTLALEIMRKFNAPDNSYKLYFNSRVLIDSFFEKELQIAGEEKLAIARIMDKFEKLSASDFSAILEKQGVSNEYIIKIVNFLEGSLDYTSLDGYKDIVFLQTKFKELGYEGFTQFRPCIIRGFEYYDGVIFEVFDLNKDNPRSMFGGGRYNGLASIFGAESFPATGFAPGNATTRIFLENWNLIPETLARKSYYLPLLDEKLLDSMFEVTNKLRRIGLNVENELTETSLTDALRKAVKNKKDYVLILGEEEIKNSQITVKDLATGKQETKLLNTFIADIA